MTPRTLVIVHTAYVTPIHGDAPYYELTAAPDLAEDAPRTVLLTRDVELYQRALDAEGTDVTFATTWRPKKRANGRVCLALEELEPLKVDELQRSALDLVDRQPAATALR